MASLHHPPPSIHLHLPSQYPALPLWCFPFLFVCVSFHLCSFIFSPHMWFCSSSLCTLSLPLLLLCHPSLTYGFPLWVCVCLVLPRVHWGSPLVCILQTQIERWRVCMSVGLWACLPVCARVCGVQQVMQQFHLWVI